jgi:hypothetical protein
MTKARDLSKLLSTANGKIAGANLDVSFENISDTGTAGTKVASGTTAQRGSTAGQIRFNTTTGLAEYYDGANFKSIDAPPTVTAVSPLEVDSTAGGNVTFTITGTNFGSGAVAKFVGNDATEITASTTTVTNSTTISAVVAKSSFVGAKEPYDVKIINGSSLSATLDNQINVDVSPAWSTASGSLGSFYHYDTVNVSATATDADSDTITYSVLSGSLPTGLSLNSSTGAITGTAGTVGSSTTSSFTLRATANSKTADRAFTITVEPAVLTFSYTGSIQSWTKPAAVSSVTAYIWGAGGGGGGRGPSAAQGKNGGAGAYSTGIINVSSLSNLYFVVGQGGFGGGASNEKGGSGGGLSAILSSSSITQGNSLLISGSGGGGSGSDGAAAGAGGGGGYANQNGSGGFADTRTAQQTEGGGGTTSAGGSAGNATISDIYTSTYPTAGSALQGGNGGQQESGGSLNSAAYYQGGRSYDDNGYGAWMGGAGGSGYFGGGGGTNGYAGGGGGGSGYANLSFLSSVSGTNGSGNSTTAPNNASAFYSSGIAVGGSPATNGGNGKIVITY